MSGIHAPSHLQHIREHPWAGRSGERARALGLDSLSCSSDSDHGYPRTVHFPYYAEGTVQHTEEHAVPRAHLFEIVNEFIIDTRDREQVKG